MTVGDLVKVGLGALAGALIACGAIWWYVVKHWPNP